MKPKSFLTGILFLASSISICQTNQDRIEIDLKSDFENINVLPLDGKGLLIQSTSTKSTGGQIELKSDFYNTKLELANSKSILIKDRTDIIDTYQENAINYSLIRNNRDYVAIVTTDTNNNTIYKIETSYTDDGELTEMTVHNNKAIFKSIENKENKIIIIDLNTGELKEVIFKIGDYRKKDITIQDFQVIDNEILVFINVKNNRKSSDLYISNINLNGAQEDFYKVTEDIEEKLIKIAATKIDNKYILTGTFSKTKSDASQGIFFGEIENKKLNYIKFYNFLELDSWMSFSSKKEQRKIERRIENANSKNKELLIDYLIKLHPIKKIDEGYLFLGEAYYPTFITYSTNKGGYRQIFDGYLYTHATLAKFSSTGDLIWDNSIEIRPDYKPKKVIDFTTLNVQNDISLTFANLKEISYKKIDKNNGKTLIDKTTEIIEATYEDDKIKKSASNIDYWFDEYYIVHGTQTVSNREKDRPRKIYFINKIKIN